MDDFRKQELTEDQYDEDEELEKCTLLDPTPSMQEQYKEMCVSVPCAPNIVTRLQSSSKQDSSYLTPSFPTLRPSLVHNYERFNNFGTSPSLRSLNPGLQSSSKQVSSYITPSFPTLPPSVVHNYERFNNFGSSPSLRSLNPGYVASLARFWSNKSRIKRDTLKSKQDDQEVNEDLDTQEFEDLTDSFMAQFEIFRASEEENLILRDELHLNLDNLKIKESMVCNLEEKVKVLDEKVTSLLKDGIEKDSRILDLEELLQKSHGNKTKHEQDGYLDFIELKKEHERLKIKVKRYEDMVEDLRDHIIPIKNLKSKIGTLDQDVRKLRERLQSNVCSTSKHFKSKICNIGVKKFILSTVHDPKYVVDNVNMTSTQEETKVLSLQSSKNCLASVLTKAFSRNSRKNPKGN